MISRIAEVSYVQTYKVPCTETKIVIILLLRLAFVIPNRKRDKKYAEGDDRYNPNVTTYEDLSDWENLHFRYLCRFTVPFLGS